jgi:hypothetical protein
MAVIGHHLRMKILSALVIVAISLGSAPAQGKACPSFFGPAVPDAATARAIATAVIRSHQPLNKTRSYALKVGRNVSGNWEAFQFVPPRTLPNGDTVVIEGGGGFQMVIDRCSGAISGLILQK